MSIFKKKATIIEKAINNKETKEVKPQKKDTLVLSQNSEKTSVLYNGKEIFSHTEEKPFIEVFLGDTILKEKGEYKKVKKVMPLKYLITKKINEAIFLKFVNKGYEVDVRIEEKDEILSIYITNKDYYEKIKLVFPRGTKEKIRGFCETIAPVGGDIIIRSRNSFDGKTPLNLPPLKTNIPNFLSSENYFFSLATLGEWDYFITKNDKNVSFGGKKSKIDMFFGKDEDEVLAKYYSKKGININFKPYDGYIFTTGIAEITAKFEFCEKNKIRLAAVILNDENLNTVELAEAIRYSKRKGFEIYVKVKPYINIDKTLIKREEIENYILRQKDNKPYIENFNGNRYVAIDLTKTEARRWLQNRIREILDIGINGVVAEKGVLNSSDIKLPQSEGISYNEIWYDVWQGLVVQALNEYPGKTLFVRDNGINSPKYGIVLADEKKWENIDSEKEDAASVLENYYVSGMGRALTEIGGLNNGKGAKYKNNEKWLALAKSLPVKIVGDMPQEYILTKKK